MSVALPRLIQYLLFTLDLPPQPQTAEGLTALLNKVYAIEAILKSNPNLLPKILKLQDSIRDQSRSDQVKCLSYCPDIIKILTMFDAVVTSRPSFVSMDLWLILQMVPPLSESKEHKI